MMRFLNLGLFLMIYYTLPVLVTQPCFHYVILLLHLTQWIMKY